MNIEARIKALEGKLSIDYITLRLSDGTERKIRGDNLLEVFREAMSREHAKREGLPIPAGKYAEEIDLILSSVSDDCRENGNGELVNLVRVLSQGPNTSTEEGAK